jgi:AcrR family transcriptional regulator
MARVSKNPEERKREIVKAAQKLFIEKGFSATKISDIVKSIGVSQGVFYYYFRSKDEVIDAIVDNYVSQLIHNTFDIVENEHLGEIEKLERIAEIRLSIDRTKDNNIRIIKGVDIRERIMTKLIWDYIPLISKAFSGDNPEVTLFSFEIFSAAANVLFDSEVIQWDQEERNKRIDYFVHLMEKSLDVKKGSLAFYRKLLL